MKLLLLCSTALLATSTAPPQKHLVVLVHGLSGTAADLGYLARRLEADASVLVANVASGLVPLDAYIRAPMSDLTCVPHSCAPCSGAVSGIVTRERSSFPRRSSCTFTKCATYSSCESSYHRGDIFLITTPKNCVKSASVLKIHPVALN